MLPTASEGERKGDPFASPASLDLSLDKLDYIDFGCGTGRSTKFVGSILDGRCVGIDRSQQAVATSNAKGYEALHGDILDISSKNAATGGFCIDVMHDIPRLEFAKAMNNMVRSVRNFLFVQQPFFDRDTDSALDGYEINGSFAKGLVSKPMIGDYLDFASKNLDALNICGISIFAFGVAAQTPMNFGDLRGGHPDRDPVPRTLRVLIGRKDLSRFRAALKKMAYGESLFIWERP